jgi:hypothetical protein
VSGASEVWPVWVVGVVWVVCVVCVVCVVGEVPDVSVAGASVPGLSVLGVPLPDAVPDEPFGLPSSSTAGTRVVDSAGAASSVLVRAPPVPDVSDDGAGSGSSGLLGVLTRTRLVGR